MANSIFGSQFSASVARILDSETGRDLMTTLNILKVELAGNSDVTDSPLQISDTVNNQDDPDRTQRELSQAKVIEPTGAIVSAIALTADALTDVARTHSDVELVCTIISKSLRLNNMVLERVQISFSNELISGSSVTLTFKQVIAPSLETVSTAAQPSDSDTAALGVRPLEDVGFGVEGLQ